MLRCSVASVLTELQTHISEADRMHLLNGAKDQPDAADAPWRLADAAWRLFDASSRLPDIARRLPNAKDAAR